MKRRNVTMDSALYKPNNTIISAEELSSWEVVNEYDFVCSACEVGVQPIAYKDMMKRRPYFRLYKNTRHQENCGMDGYEKLISIAKYKSVANEDGFPLSYPNRLIIKEIREQIANELEVGVKKTKHILTKESYETNSNDKRAHNHTVTTIRPIAKQFINFHFDLGLSLIMPMIDRTKYNTYKSVFERLSNKRINSYSDKRIFYGSLYTGNQYNNINISLPPNHFIVTLTQGEWNDTYTKPIKLYQIIIDYSHWTTKTINMVKGELDIAREERQKALDEGNNKVKSWVFFVGQQNKTNPYLFHVDDHKLICFLVADNLDYQV